MFLVTCIEHVALTVKIVMPCMDRGLKVPITVLQYKLEDKDVLFIYLKRN